MQSLCVLAVGRLCLEPLIENGKAAVNVGNQCIAVIKNRSLHTVVPLHGKAKAFREKANRNVSTSAFLVRRRVNIGGFDDLSGAVIGYGKLLAAKREGKCLPVLFSGNRTCVVVHFGTERLGDCTEGNHGTVVHLFRLCVRKFDDAAIQLHGKLLAQRKFIVTYHG